MRPLKITRLGAGSRAGARRPEARQSRVESICGCDHTRCGAPSPKRKVTRRPAAAAGTGKTEPWQPRNGPGDGWLQSERTKTKSLRRRAARRLLLTPRASPRWVPSTTQCHHAKLAYWRCAHQRRARYKSGRAGLAGVGAALREDDCRLATQKEPQARPIVAGLGPRARAQGAAAPAGAAGPPPPAVPRPHCAAGAFQPAAARSSTYSA